MVAPPYIKTPAPIPQPTGEKECLLTTVDHFIKASKISLM